MKIKGAEGYSADTIRDEVNRGGRFIHYSYCVSIVVMTFKRGSDIYFIRPGASRIVPGLPFTLISLVAGWWGFPWGPIYTIECLVRNLGGGTDVTHTLMDNLGVAPAEAPPADLPLRGSAPVPRPPSRTTFTRKQMLVGTSLLLAILVSIYAAVCFGVGQKRDAVLISGESRPYRVEINGTPYQLPPYGAVKLEIPEGDVVISDVAGLGQQTAHVESPFWTRPFAPQAVVINPDRAGLFLQHQVTYYPSNYATPPANQDESYTLYANQTIYVVAQPDYFFVEEPKTISMPSSSSSVSKSRMTELPVRQLAARLQIVKEKLGAAETAQFAKQLAKLHSSDEDALAMIAATVSHDEAIALFESRLAERPVQVEWHRIYQSICEDWGHDKSLADTYAKMAAAEPTNGALLYLQGRIEKEETSARDYFSRALQMPQPCLQAHLGLAHWDASAGNFEAALEHYQKIEGTGIAPTSVRMGKESSLLALGRYEELLAIAKQHRLENPRDLAAAVSELQVIALKTGNHDAVDAALKESTKRFEKLDGFTPAERTEARAFLEANAAYALGEEAVFATKLQAIDAPYAKFQAAVASRDHTAAELALKKDTDSSSVTHLLLYLTALGAGDSLSAEKYWNRAVQALGKERSDHETLAQALSGKLALTPEQICRLHFNGNEKRIILTALGAHDPEHRNVYHSFASKINRAPDFPRLLLEAAIKAPSYAAPLKLSRKSAERVF